MSISNHLENSVRRETSLSLAKWDLWPFLNKGLTVVYLSCSGNIPCDNDLLKMYEYVKGLLICWLHNFIILFDKPSFADEFLELSEERLLTNSAFAIGITIFLKPLGKSSLGTM